MAFAFLDMNEDEMIGFRRKLYSINYNPDDLDNMEEFDNKWQEIEEKNLIFNNEDRETKLYKVYRKTDKSDDDKNDGDNDCVVKVFKLPTKTKKNIAYKHKISWIIKTYLLIQQSRIIPAYKGLYYDKKGENMLITMEALQYTLCDYVKIKKITEYECKQIIPYLLCQLWELHRMGYIHCDIKPENIMLRCREYLAHNNYWRLIDFDNRLFIGTQQFAKYRGSVGTISWTPPEIAMDDGSTLGLDAENSFSFGVDIWSLGLIILYILFGKQPYELTEEEENKYNTYYKQHHFFYHNKLLKNDGYDMNSDKNGGEIWLKNYLISLYFDDKISKDLFDLLYNKMLIFDPRKRANCKEIWNHPWFDQFRISYKLAVKKCNNSTKPKK